MQSREGLSLEVVKEHFYFLFFIWIEFTVFIAPPFYDKLAEVPGIASGILKIDKNKKL